MSRKRSRRRRMAAGGGSGGADEVFRLQKRIRPAPNIQLLRLNSAFRGGKRSSSHRHQPRFGRESAQHDKAHRGRRFNNEPVGGRDFLIFWYLGMLSGGHE